MSIVGVLSVLMGTVSFLDSIMLIAIISFVSSVSISRFIGGGMCLMEITKEIFSLIAAVMLLLGSFIALISAIGIVKFQRCFLKKSCCDKKFNFILVINFNRCINLFYCEYRIFQCAFITVTCFINLTSPVGMHLVARCLSQRRLYVSKNDDHTHASILLSSNEQNSTEALQLHAKNEKSIVRNGIKTIEVLAKLLSITMLLKICFQI